MYVIGVQPGVELSGGCADMMRSVILMGCVVNLAAGFIFPDLKALRLGNRFQSKYKIAVLQEEPFLSANGTGYVPDLLHLVADWYATANSNGDVFPYEIHPVETWDQLMTKASATHWKISFGLIASSLMKTEGPWKQMLSSHAIVHSGLQLIGAKKNAKTTSRGSDNRQMTTTTHLPSQSPEGGHFNFNGLDIKSATLVALDGSPEAYVLQKNPGYRHQLKTVKNNDEALGHILLHPNSYFVKDSAVSERLKEQFSSELSVICKIRVNVTRSNFVHGFFGKDGAIINFFNGALRKLRETEKDQIKILNKKYFGHLRNFCPF